MDYEKVIGQEHLKNHLQKTIKNNRIAHAQLFLGKDGEGTFAMAMAYATDILCIGKSNSEKVKKQCEDFTHPDLHFVFPVNETKEIKKSSSGKPPTCFRFLKNWNDFLKEKGVYTTLQNWYQFIGLENKQGIIASENANEMVRRMSLKSFQGGFKVMIIWHADKMNPTISNKLLKFIEEPSPKTILILLSESKNALLDTIVSRCQVLNFKPLNAEQIAKSLVEKYQIPNQKAQNIAFQSQGDLTHALSLLGENEQRKSI